MIAVKPLLIALAISGLANLWLGKAWLSARDGKLRAEEQHKQARGVAKSCSEGVEKLQAESAERDRELRRNREKADVLARTHEGRAQQILARPDAVPGDACKSAEAELDAWLKGRRKP